MNDSIELVNTTELNYEIENMFRNEWHFILILSPYLDLTEKIQAILAMSDAKVVILYTEIEKESKKKKLEDFQVSMPNVEFYCIPNFHAKAYITSGTLIITSLNLYKFSQINNFELGIVLKDTTYNKIIGKLFEELKILFNMNGIDTELLDNLKLPTVQDLFNEILLKSNKKEEDYGDAELLKIFSEKLLNRYSFDRKDCWRDNENILQRWAVVNRDMYEWALLNIRF
ncbi:MAG: phospholipase D-like domain-containing protein [Treponema sp.]|jgi:phosphatidylserine/phosphatidylglycerophosphate/cardiolipin synthase-like enzyme|nr:phospholipase D-like domain-containing protein [Treponema sp.]